jgi:hypothetical protein
VGREIEIFGSFGIVEFVSWKRGDIIWLEWIWKCLKIRGKFKKFEKYNRL